MRDTHGANEIGLDTASAGSDPAPEEGTMRRLRTALFVLTYCALLAVFLEGVARLALSNHWLFEKIADYDDASNRLRWVKRHSAGIEIYYTFDVFSPDRGWMSRPGLRNAAVFGDKVLNTNSRGFRGTREYTDELPPDTPRIVVLGDSFTFGDEVSDDETYPAQLQTLLSGAEVINMGVHGYGHDQMFLLFEQEGARLRPDIVILGFVYADMWRNDNAFRDYAKPRFMLDGERLVVTNVPVPPPEEFLEKELLRSKFLDLVMIMTARLRSRLGIEERRAYSLTTRILDGLRNAIVNAGAVPVFVYLPVGREIVDLRPLTDGERYLASFCADRPEARCLSVREAFRTRASAAERRHIRGHWPPALHRIAAEVIAEDLGALSHRGEKPAN